jgi:hypothetical protein
MRRPIYGNKLGAMLAALSKHALVDEAKKPGIFFNAGLLAADLQSEVPGCVREFQFQSPTPSAP